MEGKQFNSLVMLEPLINNFKGHLKLDRRKKVLNLNVILLLVGLICLYSVQYLMC